jgi:predicted RNA-binding protein YlqC (UPF0109 family)
MEDFLRFLITPLLSEPKNLKISHTDSSVVIETDPQDTGRVIGKHGSVIHAIRVLLKTYCLANNLSPVTLILNSPPKTA